MKTFSKATNRLIPATLFELQSCWNIFPRNTKTGLDRRSPQSWPRICLERQVVLGRSSDSWPLWPFQSVSSPGEKGWSWNCWCSWSVLRFLSHLLRNHLTNTAPIWAWACKFWRVLEKIFNSNYFFAKSRSLISFRAECLRAAAVQGRRRVHGLLFWRRPCSSSAQDCYWQGGGHMQSHLGSEKRFKKSQICLKGKSIIHLLYFLVFKVVLPPVT